MLLGLDGLAQKGSLLRLRLHVYYVDKIRVPRPFESFR